MHLPPYVKSKKYIDFLPVIGRSTANAIYPYIFFPDKIYKDLRKDKPNPLYHALLVHEEAHRNRQIKMGYLKFGLKYLINPKFRFEEELEADKEYMKIIKKNKLGFNIDKRSKELSGLLYFWSIDYKSAKRALEKAWKEI